MLFHFNFYQTDPKVIPCKRKVEMESFVKIEAVSKEISLFFIVLTCKIEIKCSV